MIARFIFAGCLFGFEIALSTLLLAEESRPQPATGTRQEVWQALKTELRQQGLADPQLPRLEDIDLPSALPELAGHSLRVASVCWDEGPQRTQFRLECGAPRQCLPFLAYVHANYGSVSDSSFDPVDAPAGGHARSCQLASESHPATGSHSAFVAPPKPTVRTGERVTAVFLTEHMRMTAAVTCLERGREGEIIRVRAPDGHIFRARITGPALLEALAQ
jgi:Chaperone for flagella basal body P-ring formation